MAKTINTSSAKGGGFDKGLIEDIDGAHQQPNQWTQARNAVTNSVDGDLGELSNEASNRLCILAPYIIIGIIHVGEDEFAVFSTDNIHSEIGFFREDTCEYVTTVNDDCLRFNQANLIKGVGRTNFECGRQVYWDDGFNPSRVMSLDDVPWVQDCTVDSGGCNICTDTDVLDCDAIRLAPKLKDLAFQIERGNASGQILNGSYYVVGAYLINGQKITDYSIPSNVQPLFVHEAAGSSLDIYITEADQAFDEIELMLVQISNFNTVGHIMGVYSTRQKKITFDTIHETLPKVTGAQLGDVLKRNPVIDKSDAIYRNGQYLIRTGPTDKFDFNYQPLANQIASKWVSIEYDAEYYRDGGSNTGYMRDEVYSFFIRWVWCTGDKSASYHIPGRVSKSSDTTLAVNSSDIVDGDDALLHKWKAYNTAAVDPSFPGVGTILPPAYDLDFDPANPPSPLPNDYGTILAGGEMSYWESSELYDDDKPQVWNGTYVNEANVNVGSTTDVKYDLCGRPIRHHKFPDNALTDASGEMVANHYDPDDGTKIRIMGVQFDNIKPPVDNDGNPIPEIVGYEILRGSREGNKSILAKGMINNMRAYKEGDVYKQTGAYDPAITTDDKILLYPNYPYNPTALDANYTGGQVMDHFLSAGHTETDNGSLFASKEEALNNFNAYLNDDAPLGSAVSVVDSIEHMQRQMLTFHSPETNFSDPFLSAKELRIYGELHGTMNGKFQFPKDHPKHKLITNMSFVVSALIGIGYAMVSTEGTKTVAHEAPHIDYGGSYAQVGVSTGTTGVAGPSAIQAGLMSGSVAASLASTGTINSLLSTSVLSMFVNMAGVDSNLIRDNSLNVSSNIAGAIGGVGGKETFSREETPWGAVPDLIRVIQGIPAFLTYWGEGVTKMLDIIYAFTPYRQYALQQVSHCFYDKFAAPDQGDLRRSIEYQQYLNPEIQDFARDYRINNIYRSRTVSLKLAANLALPYKQVDNSQATFSDVWGRGHSGGEDFSAYWKDEGNVNTGFQRDTSSHYVGMKQRLNNQYGQIGNITQVPVSTNATESPLIDPTKSRSPVLFNGDIYIGRYTEKNTMPFFYDWLKGQPDGAEMDYRLRKNVAHPRFWMNTEPFDVGEFLQSLGTIFESDTKGASSNFDPFLPTIPEFTVDPVTGQEVPSPGYVVCDCADTGTNCFFDQSDVDEICELQEELAQITIYRDYVDACACSDDSDCSDDDDYVEPWDDPDYDTCTDSNYHPYKNKTGENPDACSECPSWSNSDAYLDDGSKKWGRKIKRLDRKIERAQKKLDKKKDKMYKDWIDSMDGNDDSWLEERFDGVVTPNDKYAFDKKDRLKFRFAVRQAYMYLFVSGVRDFFVETEINLAHRDWGDKQRERHFDYINYTNYAELFSTDHIKVGNYLKYDKSLSISKIFNNYISWGNVQSRQYDPEIAKFCYTYRPKRLVYSLPQGMEDKKDNWRIFLPNNYKDFNSVCTAIKPIGKNGALMLFQNESPIQIAGVDVLKTDGGTKITIGDGGLFSQPLQNLANADYPHEYGSCQNRLSVVNTPGGLFYMSQNQGKVFQVQGNGLQEISNAGMKFWFTRYLPYQLTQHPTAFIDPVTNAIRGFDLVDNPVLGIGCQTIFDNENQIVYFCKKDWVIREDILDVVTYIGGNQFSVGVTKSTVSLGDPRYFKSASWTVSYDVKTQLWIGWHDWHPDLTIPTKRTYLTTKGDGVWVHADRCDSYCNFYGVDYPFEVEFTMHTQGQVNTLRNVAYYMEVYKYAANCDDRFHELDFNFDEAIVYNTEQNSGLLRLNNTPKNDVVELVRYPEVNPAWIEILYAKEEQEYRFNQFWDITDDRGEFNPVAQRTMFNTEPNGYIKNLNPNNLNYSKNEFERKKFRHYQNTVLLRRRVSGDKNMIISLAVEMNLNSPR